MKHSQVRDQMWRSLHYAFNGKTEQELHPIAAQNLLENIWRFLEVPLLEIQGDLKLGLINDEA